MTVRTGANIWCSASLDASSLGSTAIRTNYPHSTGEDSTASRTSRRSFSSTHGVPHHEIEHAFAVQDGARLWMLQFYLLPKTRAEFHPIYDRTKEKLLAPRRQRPRELLAAALQELGYRSAIGLRLVDLFAGNSCFYGISSNWWDESSDDCVFLWLVNTQSSKQSGWINGNDSVSVWWRALDKSVKEGIVLRMSRTFGRVERA